MNKTKHYCQRYVHQKFQVQFNYFSWGNKGCPEAISKFSGKKLYNKNNPPVFIAHGTDDNLVDFKNALDVKNISTDWCLLRILPFEGKGHGPWNS